MYIPLPIAMPIPTVAQIPAAVVTPEIVWLRTKITPAPIKPTAVTMPAAIRKACPVQCYLTAERLQIRILK